MMYNVASGESLSVVGHGRCSLICHKHFIQHSIMANHFLFGVGWSSTTGLSGSQM